MSFDACVSVMPHVLRGTLTHIPVNSCEVTVYLSINMCLWLVYAYVCLWLFVGLFLSASEALTKAGVLIRLRRQPKLHSSKTSVTYQNLSLRQMTFMALHAVYMTYSQVQGLCLYLFRVIFFGVASSLFNMSICILHLHDLQKC